MSKKRDMARSDFWEEWLHVTYDISGSLIFGRFGTTLSKVSIHQLYQEEVPRHERGTES